VKIAIIEEGSVTIAVATDAASIAAATQRSDVDFIATGEPSADERARFARGAPRDPALDEVLRSQSRQLAELRAALEREDVADEPPPPARAGVAMFVYDEHSFLALARHEERRARVHARPLAVARFDPPRATVDARPFDVLLIAPTGEVVAALYPEADPASVPSDVRWFPSDNESVTDALTRR